MDHAEYWRTVQSLALADARRRGLPTSSPDPEIQELRLCKALLHAISEVVEAFEELRAGRPVNTTWYEQTFGAYPKPKGVPTELADAVICIASVAEQCGIDLGTAIARKMAYNNLRAPLSGKAL